MIEFASAVGAVVVSIYSYVPSVSQGGGGSNDGVISSIALALSGTNLTATAGRTVGTDVVSNILALPAGGGGTADGVIDSLALTLTGSAISATAGRTVGVDVASAGVTLPFAALAGATFTGIVSGISTLPLLHI